MRRGMELGSFAAASYITMPVSLSTTRSLETACLSQTQLSSVKLQLEYTALNTDACRLQTFILQPLCTHFYSICVQMVAIDFIQGYQKKQDIYIYTLDTPSICVMLFKMWNLSHGSNRSLLCIHYSKGAFTDSLWYP